MSTTLQHLSDLVGGQIVHGEPSLVISGLNSINQAQPGEITFLGNPRYLPSLKTTQASAALIALDSSVLAEIPETLALIRSGKSHAGFFQCHQAFRATAA
ncbi:MAG: hypothetical protein IPK22_15095 [Verrucomicrobiaceae bacterium]|nr:hypothetical protein [Verrucomicrobiaceae bacterium]